MTGAAVKKISYYKMLTTFYVFPVTDWPAFIQRTIGRILLTSLVFRLFSLLKQPLFIAALIGLLIWSPDTIAWIFIKIGEIEMRVITLMLAVVMPEIFSAGGNEYKSWADIWSAGLAALPPDVVAIMNGLGVAQILGLVTATWGAVSSVKIYRKIMLRAGLL